MLTIDPYYTFFQGAFRFAEGKKLTEHQYPYLMLFWGIARSKRDVRILKQHKDPIRDLVGLPLGPEGAFSVSSQDFLDLPKELQVSTVCSLELSRGTHIAVSRWNKLCLGLSVSLTLLGLWFVCGRLHMLPA